MRIYLAIIALICFSCEQPNSDLSEFYDAAGGLEMWNNLEELSFTKKSRLFYPDSTIEQQSLQKQIFRNSPEFYAEIIYLQDSLQRRIIQNGEQVKLFEKGEEVTDQEKIDKARTNIRTAYYIIALPFKLQDEGVNVQSIKTDTMPLFDESRVIHVTHDSNPDQNWWLYFDLERSEMQGYLIEHDNRFSYIMNDITEKVDGLVLPIERRSVALDNNFQNAYLRADYIYSDYKVKTK